MMHPIALFIVAILPTQKHNSALNIFNYVDTQVKYDKEYRYTVFAYQVVLGTKYAYKNFCMYWYEIFSNLNEVSKYE